MEYLIAWLNTHISEARRWKKKLVLKNFLLLKSWSNWSYLGDFHVSASERESTNFDNGMKDNVADVTLTIFFTVSLPLSTLDWSWHRFCIFSSSRNPINHIGEPAKCWEFLHRVHSRYTAQLLFVIRFIW